MSDGEGTGAPESPPARPLEALHRALLVTAAWGAYALASPGLLTPGGVPPLAFGAMALWAFAVTRPGRRAFLIEWLPASLALGGLMAWLAYISPWVLLPTGIGMGLYMASAGALARALSRRVPLALAAGLAWVSLETLRDMIEPPFGMGWLRLAHAVVDFELLAGSARVWGIAGVSFATAALGGGLAGAWRALAGGSVGCAARELAIGLAPLGLAMASVLVVPPPPTEDGPTILLVQPNISQARKQAAKDDRSIVLEHVRLSRDGQAAGPVDLVVWSETMLRIEVASAGAVEAAAAGASFDSWQDWRGDASAHFELLERYKDVYVDEAVFGEGIGGFAGGAALIEGTAFLSGTEEWRALDGRLRRFNVGALWSTDREMSTAAKTHLVPLGESTFGLERYEIVRRAIFAMAGYVPDFASSPPSSVAFEDRSGRTWGVGIAICFDNAFIESFGSGVDFHVVLSNEAWYRRSVELDQMIASTRLAAIASGRSVARCTNSGISAVFDPRGRELARLRVDGDDREVSGTLRAVVPVPQDPSSSTVFSALRPLWRTAWVLLAFALLGIPTRLRESHAISR